MASTFSTDLALELVATGEKAGLWGTITNTNLQVLQQSTSGVIDVAMTSGSDVTLALSDGATSNGKNIYLKLISILPLLNLTNLTFLSKSNCNSISFSAFDFSIKS